MSKQSSLGRVAEGRCWLAAVFVDSEMSPVFGIAGLFLVRMKRIYMGCGDR